MSETVVSIQAMPDVLMRLVRAERVRIRENNGIVTVIPVQESDDCPLYGFFGDGKLSTERFLEQKRLDKELEEG